MSIFSSISKGLGIAAVTGLTVIFCNGLASSANASGWENEISVYGWFSDISGEVQNGSEWSYDVEDILDDLQMIFMGGYEGRIGKWSFIGDLVYLAVGDESDVSVPAGTVRADVDLDSWVISGGVGYDLFQSDRGRLAVVAGLRYIDMELESDLTFQGTEVPAASGSKDLLDGTIGVRGYVNLSSGWFLPYYADIGTGDSDVSYQLFGGVGYQFGWGDIRVGYRYLCIEMEDDKIMSDLTISGPVAGVGFRF